MAEPDEQERRRGLRALFSVLARTLELPTIPLPSGEHAELVPMDDAVAILAEAQYIPAPLRLEVLARMRYAQKQLQRTAFDQAEFDRGVERLADSLTNKPLMNDGARIGLLERLDQWEPGREPLGRSTTDLTVPDSLVADLDPTVQTTALTFTPECDASTTDVRGIPAMNISTQAITTRPIAEFERIVDPLQWPNCWLQQDFFRRMERVRPAPPPPFPSNEHGWKEIILEVVDFGAFGVSPNNSTMETELDFVFFFPATPHQPGDFARAGCTYDLYRSRDGKIEVDQGFLLVEDLRPTENLRRYRTQKVVHFKAGDTPALEVCTFWSLAAGMILHGC
jgi:hypothetical protein